MRLSFMLLAKHSLPNIQLDLDTAVWYIAWPSWLNRSLSAVSRQQMRVIPNRLRDLRIYRILLALRIRHRSGFSSLLRIKMITIRRNTKCTVLKKLALATTDGDCVHTRCRADDQYRRLRLLSNQWHATLVSEGLSQHNILNISIVILQHTTSTMSVCTSPELKRIR
jgi:hypothetical protein